MRTTLSIDDDVLAAARELAEMEKKSIGEIISLLARKSMQPESAPRQTRNGVPLLPVPPGARRVTSEMVRRLDNELP